MSYLILPTELYDPPIATDRLTMEVGEYDIHFWIQLNSIQIENPNLPVTIIHFPRFYYVQRVKIWPGQKADYVWAHMARRVRNYLALCFWDQIPLYYKIVGKDTLMTQLFQGSYLHANLMTHGYTQETVDKEFPATHAYVINLLETIELDSYRDKLANLFGTLYWTDDLIDRFMYSWRIIELISNETISSFSKDDFGNFGVYIGNKSLESFTKRLYICDKISVTLRKLVPHINLEHLEAAYKLRNMVFHGAISAKAYSVADKEIRWVINTSDELVKCVFPTIFTGIKIDEK